MLRMAVRVVRGKEKKIVDSREEGSKKDQKIKQKLANKAEAEADEDENTNQQLQQSKKKNI